MMSQPEISASMVKLRARTKQMVEIKQKLKLDRSASNAQAANWRQTVGTSTYFTKRKKYREKVQNRVGRKTIFAGSS